MNSPTALVRLRARWEGSQNVATELSELAICGSVFPHPHLDATFATFCKWFVVKGLGRLNTGFALAGADLL